MGEIKIMKIKDILIETRKWAEGVAEEFGYHSCLTGLCAIVSKELFVRLKANGYRCKIGYNNGHCFIIYKNRIFDLTATQFGKPEIYIFSLSVKTPSNWKIKRAFYSAKNLSDYQIEKSWPDEQICIESY